MRSVHSLNSYTKHFLVNKLFMYKYDLPFKTLISMAIIAKRDRYNVLFDVLCNKLLYM